MADLLGHEPLAPVARGRRSRLPADWTPTPEARQFAIALGLDPDQVAPMFRDYWVATGKAMLDWRAAWQVWCRREAERTTRTYPHHKIVNGSQPAVMPGAVDELWQARLRGYRPGGFWPSFWGPRPESGQSHAPRAALEAWRASQPRQTPS